MSYVKNVALHTYSRNVLSATQQAIVNLNYVHFVTILIQKTMFPPSSKRSNFKKSAQVLSYCYNPVKNSLLNILKRKGHLDMCEHWRNRRISDTVLADIYDAQVWKEWMVYDGRPFLSCPYNIALSVIGFSLLTTLAIV